MLLLVKLQANFSKSITPLDVFHFFKMCKWYQIAQSITYIFLNACFLLFIAS